MTKLTSTSPNPLNVRSRFIWLFAILALTFSTFLNGCTPNIPVGLELTQPTDNLTVITDSILVNGTVSNATSLSYVLNGGSVQTLDATSESFTFNISLREGSNTLTVTATNRSNQKILTRNIIYNKPPEVELRLIQPTSDITVASDSLVVEGIVQNADELSYRLNDANPVNVNISEDSFSFNVTLRAGENTIQINAKNIGNSATLTRKVTLSNSKNAYSVNLTQNAPSFTRPSTGTGMTAAQRTAKYHLFSYTAASSSYHEIASTQSFDGYLLLYKGVFEPQNPSKNLVAQNDDSAAFDEITGGKSRIRALLEKNQAYSIVTTACGTEDGGCGPSIGSFSNSITANVPAPPPVYKLPTPDNSRYNITLRFAQDDVTKQLTLAQSAVFEEAVAYWEQIITGDVANFGSDQQEYPADFVVTDTGAVSGVFDDILIDVKFSDLDGPGGLLGQAAPRIVRLVGEDAPLTVWGMMEFDIGEFQAGGSFTNSQVYKDTIVHEMAHVIGIGTLWTDQDLVDENYSTNPPRVPGGLPNPNYNPGFTGVQTVGEYNKLLTAIGEEGKATVVPIANSGGPGNFNGHWRELVFGTEIMTPFADGAEQLSRMTVASLQDLGYTVNRNVSLIDSSYVLPPPPVAAQMKQIKPNQVTYEELRDFAAAKDSIKAEVTAIVQSVDLKLNDIPNSSSGCDVADYVGFVTNSIALVRRGGCLFREKIDLAVANGASGIVIMNQGDAPDRREVFGIGGLTEESKIPVMAISYDLGVTLAGISGLELYLNTGVRTNRSAISTQALNSRFANFEIISGPIGGMLPDGRIIVTGERPEVLDRVRKLYEEQY